VEHKSPIRRLVNSRKWQQNQNRQHQQHQQHQLN
jgi:hypothetical protein